MDNEKIPYIAFESEMARHERSIKRLIIALALTIALLFTSNIAWRLWNGSQASRDDGWNHRRHAQVRNQATRRQNGINVAKNAETVEISTVLACWQQAQNLRFKRFYFWKGTLIPWKSRADVLKFARSEGTLLNVLIRTYPMRKAGYSPAFFRANEKQAEKLSKNRLLFATPMCQKGGIYASLNYTIYKWHIRGKHTEFPNSLLISYCKQKGVRALNFQRLGRPCCIPMFPIVTKYDGFKSPSLRQ